MTYRRQKSTRTTRWRARDQPGHASTSLALTSRSSTPIARDLNLADDKHATASGMLMPATLAQGIRHRRLDIYSRDFRHALRRFHPRACDERPPWSQHQNNDL
jgi:hypothetical protein